MEATAPGKSLDTSSTFSGLPDASDEFRGKAGRQVSQVRRRRLARAGFRDELRATSLRVSDVLCTREEAAPESQELPTPTVRRAGSGGHLGCLIWPPAAFRGSAVHRPAVLKLALNSRCRDRDPLHAGFPAQGLLARWGEFSKLGGGTKGCFLKRGGQIPPFEKICFAKP